MILLKLLVLIDIMKKVLLNSLFMVILILLYSDNGNLIFLLKLDGLLKKMVNLLMNLLMITLTGSYPKD
jgi:hypothetical protein